MKLVPVAASPSSSDDVIWAMKFVITEHLVHQRPDAMHIFVADLDEDGAGVGEQIAGDGEAVAKVGEVGVDAVAPGVAEGFDLFGLAGDVVGVAVLDVAAGGGPLEVGVELDAVGRVEVDALDLAAQALALGEEAMTWRLSPRIMRLVQLASCW